MSVGCGDGSVLVLKKKNDKKVSKWTRFSLNGHNSAVVSVQIANDLLYSCSNNGELFTWNLKSNAQIPCDKLKFSSKLNAVRTITSSSPDSAPCNLLLATTNSIFFLQQQL
jgi:WD40 repeat protein